MLKSRMKRKRKKQQRQHVVLEYRDARNAHNSNTESLRKEISWKEHSSSLSSYSIFSHIHFSLQTFINLEVDSIYVKRDDMKYVAVAAWLDRRGFWYKLCSWLCTELKPLAASLAFASKLSADNKKQKHKSNKFRKSFSQMSSHLS